MSMVRSVTRIFLVTWLSVASPVPKAIGAIPPQSLRTVAPRPDPLIQILCFRSPLMSVPIRNVPTGMRMVPPPAVAAALTAAWRAVELLVP